MAVIWVGRPLACNLRENKVNWKPNTWAIFDFANKNNPKPLGIYYFGLYHIPDECEGFRVATFATRQKARDAIKKHNIKRGRPKARVVQIGIEYYIK